MGRYNLKKRITHGVIVIILFASFLSCSKDKDTKQPDNTAFLLLQKHVWLLDSFYFYGVDSSLDKGYHIDTLNQFVKVTDTTFTQQDYMDPVTYHIEFEAPQKLYYWYPESAKDTGVFIQIKLVTDTSLITLYNFDNTNYHYYYYHAQR